MTRSPITIAAEARKTLDNASRAFVPPNLARLGELSVEFMESTAAALEAAGLVTPDEPAADQAAG